jgi:hypothetical protein
MHSMILDVHTPEGRTLKQFCSNFAVLEKNPATLVMNVRHGTNHHHPIIARWTTIYATACHVAHFLHSSRQVRQFMDDMRAYIIERHAGELAKLTVEAAAVRALSRSSSARELSCVCVRVR